MAIEDAAFKNFLITRPPNAAQGGATMDNFTLIRL
jgi:hypothetical protein